MSKQLHKAERDLLFTHMGKKEKRSIRDMPGAKRAHKTLANRARRRLSKVMCTAQ